MQLYPYQVDYLDNLPKNIIMACDVGLGKTIMALEHYRRYAPTRQRIQSDTFGGGSRKVSVERAPIVVVAPASKVRTGDWQREIDNFFDGQARVEITNYGPNDPQPLGFSYDVIQDYEVLSYEMFTKRWRELVDENTTLIIDESHMACNATTKRGKAVILASRIAHQWIMLSATPLPNGWRSGEVYAILTGLVRNKTEFVNRFEVIDRRRGFPLLLGYREEATLNTWWNTIAKPLQRTGELKLPSENIPAHATMAPSVGRIYNRALKDRLFRVDGEDELLDNSSKLFAKLRQIPTPARIEALENVLNDTDEHVVVFYNYNIEREAILALLAKSFKERKVYEQSGYKSNLPSRDRWGNLKPSVTLVQYQSGSQAIELTYASVTVYLSPCTSYANYEQSKGRTRRNGQQKTTLFYHISVKDTLDKHIWGLLKKKQSFTEHMFSEYVDNITT